MKVELVVTSGVHQGKTIPILIPQFLIGRDAQCQLRPASQAVSKLHCGIIIREGSVYVKDFGSTNGTIVNDVTIRNSEVEVRNGATLKVGPLDFEIRITKPTGADGTPLPQATPESAAALAAVQASTGKGSEPRDPTPYPPPQVQQTPPAAPVTGGSKEQPALGAVKAQEISDQDRIAAILLSLESEEIPEGNTVVDVPALTQSGSASGSEAKKPDAKKVPTREEMTNAANEALRKIMRRPR